MGDLYKEEVNSIIVWLIPLIFAAVAAFLFFVVPGEEFKEAPVFVLPLIGTIFLVVTLVFRKLVITIDRELLTLGFSIFKSRIKLSEIVSCEKTKVKWYIGLGLKTNFRDFYYNARYGDAVWIKLKNNRGYLFSTNKPDTVCRVIEDATGM